MSDESDPAPPETGRPGRALPGRRTLPGRRGLRVGGCGPVGVQGCPAGPAATPDRRSGCAAPSTGLGLRFRVQKAVLPRCTPDFVLPRHRIAVYVDGCFWHGCPVHGPKDFRGPNRDRWAAKLDQNRDRDRRNTSRLEEAGWTVLRFWECEVRDDLDRCVRPSDDTHRPTRPVAAGSPSSRARRVADTRPPDTARRVRAWSSGTARIPGPARSETSTARSPAPSTNRPEAAMPVRTTYTVAPSAARLTELPPRRRLRPAGRGRRHRRQQHRRRSRPDRGDRRVRRRTRGS